MLTAVNQVSYPFFKPSCHLLLPILAEFDMDSSLLFPHTPRLEAVAQRINEGAMEFSRRPSGVLGVWSPSQPSCGVEFSYKFRVSVCALL